VADKIF